VVGGLLIAARPDGALLQAPLLAPASSPFPDGRLHGLLLATLVGGGFTAAGKWNGTTAGTHPFCPGNGLGLVCFELAELAWSGFQPLQAVFTMVGVTVCVLAAAKARAVSSATDAMG
jgi:hypothetical protein